MMKNEYRRALIMFRPIHAGYSGHVRLERRTLMGSMYFTVGAPADSGELCAALIRRDREGTYFAERIGVLRRDGRGQAGLAYTFDPRNIGGFALEDYILIAIVDSRENCGLVLTGNVNGSQEVNLSSVRIAACGACGFDRLPVCEPCTPTEPPQRPDGPPTVTPLPPPVGFPEKPDAPAVDEEEGFPPNTPTPIQPRTDTAAQTAGIDASLPWPGSAEQVRGLFASRPARELMLNDGYTYVRAEMPEETGYDHVNIGVRFANGRPESVAYALPGRFTPEPPPGLEGYNWQGGAADGWWVIRTDAETGEALDPVRLRI